MGVFTKDDLKSMQEWPLNRKILVTQTRIIEWLNLWHGKAYVSFSGGKDSTVMADIAAGACQITGYSLNLLYINNGLDHSEILPFIKSFTEYLRGKYRININLECVVPDMPFPQIITKFGYPLFKKEIAKDLYYAQKGAPWALCKFDGRNKDGTTSEFRQRWIKYKPYISTPFMISDKCCVYMREEPAKKYERRTGNKPIIATMASESQRRQQGYLRVGCNSFETERPRSTPMGFWTEQDVLRYLKEMVIPYCSVYGDIVVDMDTYRTTGVDRTGCLFCLLGAQNTGITKFKELKNNIREQKRIDYCLCGGEFDNDGLWKPSREGLGMKFVCDYFGWEV